LAPEAAVEPETAVHAVSRSLDDTAREPLYIIDGVILFSTEALESLTAEDIRSIEVIKVADEGSYYQNLPKRSVVIITTHAAASRRR
jgi:4-hydroxy-3-methylbut-2-enyl diphosphate reductase IspH